MAPLHPQLIVITFNSRCLSIHTLSAASLGGIMALTTPKFREDFERSSVSGAPPLDSPPLAAAMLMTHAAFVQPERQIAVFDAIAHAWLDVDDADERAASLRRQQPWLGQTAPSSDWTTPRAVWDAFWGVVDAGPAAAPGDAPQDAALDFTGRVVAIGRHYDAELLMRCERAHFLPEDVRKLLVQPEVRLTPLDFH